MRQNTVAKIIEQGRVTEDEADKLIDDNPITIGAMGVEAVNEWGFKPKVIDVMQSDFEEAEVRVVVGVAVCVCRLVRVAGPDLDPGPDLGPDPGPDLGPDPDLDL